MQLATLTLAAIESAVLINAEFPHRRHLGASAIGGKCARELWYKFRWAAHEKFEPRMLRLFSRGHHEEPHIHKLLRDAGMEVWAIGQDRADFDWRLSASDGHFGGTPDGVVRGVPDLPADECALLECKTAAFDLFKKFKEDGVMTASWKYFVQAQIYMGELGLKHALFYMVNKDNDELHAEIIRYDEKIHKEYMARGDMIIRSQEPPPRIADTPGHYACRFCAAKQLCHFNDIPEINCRTCAHSSLGPHGTWLCARGRPEVAGRDAAMVCNEHVFDPRFFDGVEVVDGNFEENWIGITHETEGYVKLGPKHRTSQSLFESGWLPF